MSESNPRDEPEQKLHSESGSQDGVSKTVVEQGNVSNGSYSGRPEQCKGHTSHSQQGTARIVDDTKPEFNGGQSTGLVHGYRETVCCHQIVIPGFAAMADQSNDKRIKYEVVSVRERHGSFRKAIPFMPLPVSIFLCFVNILAPGIGTFLSGFTVLCGCRTEHDSPSTAVVYNILAAILQLVSAPIVIGWVWSIMWGVTFVNMSCLTKDEIMAATQV